MHYLIEKVKIGVGLILSLSMFACCENIVVSDYDGSKLWFQHELNLKKGNAIIVLNDSTPTLKLINDELSQFNLSDTVCFKLDGDSTLGNEGFELSVSNKTVTAHGNSDVALLYATFELMRQQNTDAAVVTPTSQVPSYELRMLNHWDNMDGTVERGYAGKSLWHWNGITDADVQRYKEYARANASVGINAVVLNNVNASPEILSANTLPVVASIADILRPYGIKVFLSVNFSSPMNLSGLLNADPLNPHVRNWWNEKAQEIYSHIPDFGGFLVKANSEGLPGPLDYGRSHSDGANMLAEALNPFGGVVVWRAFVYSPSDADRAKQAYLEFNPLDGEFADNVIIQIKNGPIDFQPREPFSPLFGALNKTQMAVELQITQEYTGASNHMCFLPMMWCETLNSDTYRDGAGSTIAKLTIQKIEGAKHTAIAGVANIGDAANWCTHPLAQANWYSFGRLAWNADLTPDSLATEWIRLTIPDLPRHAENTLHDMLLESHEAVVDYMMPLGLHHIFAWGHHYGPEPWCDVPGARPDWMPKYYHRADEKGLGSNRSKTGSNATGQYHEPLASQFDNLTTCPEKYLLWFHHVDWNFRMKNGQTMWNELCRHYDNGLTMTDHFLASWKRLKPYVDEAMWEDVNNRLTIQRDDARWWHDGCLLYFQQYSKMPIPQKTIYKLEDMMKFHINITNYECAQKGYRGEEM